MIKVLAKIAGVIKDNDDFLIASHESPDGDAIGSMAAMGYLLKNMGRRFAIFSESRIPEKFNWLDMPGPVINEYQPGSHSWIFVLDCGSFQRAGRKLSTQAAEPIINIDHHQDNPRFGQINWVDTSFSAVGEMVAKLADNLNMELKGPMAEGLYLALVSDTGFFSYGNTSPQVLELSAKLIRNGINPGLINPKILNRWSIGKLHLHGMAMQKASFYLSGRVGILSITKKMLEETGTTPGDCEGLVNTVKNVKGVDVAISLREDKPGRIKFSLRSTGNIDVQLMAADLQGGGHKNASGGMIDADIDTARDRIVEIATSHLAGEVG